MSVRVVWCSSVSASRRLQLWSHFASPTGCGGVESRAASSHQDSPPWRSCVYKRSAIVLILPCDSVIAAPPPSIPARVGELTEVTAAAGGGGGVGGGSWC